MLRNGLTRTVFYILSAGSFIAAPHTSSAQLPGEFYIECKFDSPIIYKISGQAVYKWRDFRWENECDSSRWMSEGTQRFEDCAVNNNRIFFGEVWSEQDGSREYAGWIVDRRTGEMFREAGTIQNGVRTSSYRSPKKDFKRCEPILNPEASPRLF